MTANNTLIFDVETHNADLLYTLPPEEFVRLVGYKWIGGGVVLTTDLDELRGQIRQARWIIGHNIHSFDLKAVFGPDSNEPWELTRQGRVYDTWTHAVLVHPAPRQYVNRHGKKRPARTPEEMGSWFALDEQAHQLGVPGKTADLAELAREFGNPDLAGKEREDSGYGRIPVDEPRYRDYLIGDVQASEQVARALLQRGGLTDYALREQRIAACAAVISSNGLRVDQDAAQARIGALSQRRDTILRQLQQEYGLPTTGKAPWATDAGREAILRALAEYGITPQSRPDWPRTTTGNLSLGGEALVRLTEGTRAADLGTALAELKGQRSLAQLAVTHTHPDGRVHPDITMLQRSGRWSTTKPGLTVWSTRGEGIAEKAYFVPDTDEEVLLELDYSNADARIVAALSGDTKYAERFQPGADGHRINAIAAWGQETVDTDPDGYRQKAKPLGHGWSYGGGAKSLARESGVAFDDAKSFCDGMNQTYHVLVGWQNRVRKHVRNHHVVNEWGRPMYVEPGREFTQVPALHGQSGTREIVCDAILRMPPHVLRRVKAQIHDALLFSVPRRNWKECRDYLIDLMETAFEPNRGGQRIAFPVEAGHPGETWMEAAH